MWTLHVSHFGTSVGVLGGAAIETIVWRKLSPYWKVETTCEPPVNLKIPVVSVALPVYNGDRWLDGAVHSILNQTFTDLELIISDNASTDATREICEEWVNRDSRVRYYRNDKNIGLIPNHNLAFGKARGEFFLWFADDDLHLPESLAQRVTYLRAHPEVILVYAASETIDDKGAILPHAVRPIRVDDPSAEHRFSYLLSNIPAEEAVLYGLMRRDVLGQTTLLRNCHGGDRCLVAELSLHGQMHKLPTVLFYRRLHGRNVPTSQEEPWRFRPELSGKLIFPEWRIACEHLRTIFRGDYSIGMRLNLLRIFSSWMLGRRQLLKTELGFAWYYFRQRLQGKNPTLSPADRAANTVRQGD